MSRENHHSMDEVRSDYRTSHLNKGQFYDDALSADAWNAYVADQELRIVADIITKLFPRPPGRCLDFACGTGRVTTFLEHLAKECVGIDVSPGMVEKAKAKCKRTGFLVCDLTRESPDLGLFDLITAFRFFGNAQDELRSEALLALSRYLDHSGYLILNNHRNPNAVQNILYRRTGGKSNMDLTFAKLKRHARTCGFEVVDIRGIGGWSLRHRWQSWVETPSKRVRILERVSRLRLFATFAPDCVVVLRKSTVSRKNSTEKL